MKLNVNKDGLDLDQFALIVGEEKEFPGFTLQFVRTKDNILFLSEEDKKQLTGQKVFGLISLQVQYKSRPFVGYWTQVYFEPSDKVRQQVDYMRESLQSANVAVLDFYGLSKDNFNIDLDDEQYGYEMELESYLLLNQFYRRAYYYFNSGIESVDCELTNIYEKISVPIHKAHPITTDMIYSAHRNKEKFCSYQREPEADNKMDRTSLLLPQRVHLKRQMNNYNTPINRYTLYILSTMLKESDRISKYIEEEISNYDDLKNSTYGGYAIQLDYKMQRLKVAWHSCKTIYSHIIEHIELLKQLGVDSRKPNKTVKGSIKPAYAALFRAFQRYRISTALVPKIINVDEKSFPLQTYSISRLYEIWVVHVISKVMIENLGFTMAFDDIQSEYSVSSPSGILKSGKTLVMTSPKGSRVYFHYDKKYPSLHNPFSQDLLGFVSMSLGGREPISKNNPDISIEFYDGFNSAPKIIVLDATYSNNPIIHEQKTYYEDTILYRNNIDAPKQEWEQPVRIAIAVHPFPKQDGLPRKREIALVPGPESYNQAEESIRNILRRENLI